MFEFEIEIIINKKTICETITADTFREALDFASLKYPHADYIELA